MDMEALKHEPNEYGGVETRARRSNSKESVVLYQIPNLVLNFYALFTSGELF